MHRAVLYGASSLTEAVKLDSQHSPAHWAAESVGPGRLSRASSEPVAIITVKEV